MEINQFTAYKLDEIFPPKTGFRFNKNKKNPRRKSFLGKEQLKTLTETFGENFEYLPKKFDWREKGVVRAVQDQVILKKFDIYFKFSIKYYM